jgi:hypothetical protein
MGYFTKKEAVWKRCNNEKCFLAKHQDIKERKQEGETIFFLTKDKKIKTINFIS